MHEIFRIPIYLQEIKLIDNIDKLEEFMLKHGENIVDMMGGEIDRIEVKLRVSREMNDRILYFNVTSFQNKYPEIRHCDLEIL